MNNLLGWGVNGWHTGCDRVVPHMKNQNTKNSEFSLESEREGTPQMPTPEQISAAWSWWNELNPMRKVAAFELGVVVQALQGELRVNTLAGEVKLERAYKKFRRELLESFDERPHLLMHYYEPRRELINQ